MDIQWIRYSGAKGVRYLLALELGSRGGRGCLLECSRVPDREIALLREAKRQLAPLSLDQRLAWVKAHCPLAWRHAYREIPAGKLTVLRRY